MIDIASLKIGDKVHYQPSHHSKQEWENGTELRDLKFGWKY